VKAVPAGEERQNAIADAIVRNAGAKLENMPADKVRGLCLSAQKAAQYACPGMRCVHHLTLVDDRFYEYTVSLISPAGV
jgi:hypothetical protein